MDASRHTSHQLNISVCRDLIRVAAGLRRHVDVILGPVGLSGPQFGLLNHLDTSGSMPLSELGKRLWVTCGNVTGLVDRLVAAGYVRRTRLQTDRRVILAELTDHGREVLEDLRPAYREHVAQFTSALGEDELRELDALLQKICGAECERGE